VRVFENGREAALFRRDMATSAEQELVRRTSLGQINVSPDGKFIATPSSNRANNTRSLLLIATDGSGVRDLVTVQVKPEDLANNTNGPMVSAPMWSRDSKSVLARKRQSASDTVHEQWLIPIDGTPRKLETPIASNTWLWPVHPDGRQMLYTVGTPGTPQRLAQIWALENFLPGGK
jgi:Tol biopolymer transport system component